MRVSYGEIGRMGDVSKKIPLLGFGAHVSEFHREKIEVLFQVREVSFITWCLPWVRLLNR